MSRKKFCAEQTDSEVNCRFTNWKTNASCNLLKMSLKYEKNQTMTFYSNEKSSFTKCVKAVSFHKNDRKFPKNKGTKNQRKCYLMTFREYFFLTSDLKNRHVSRLFLTHLQGMTEYKITKYFQHNEVFSTTWKWFRE